MSKKIVKFVTEAVKDSEENESQQTDLRLNLSAPKLEEKNLKKKVKLSTLNSSTDKKDDVAVRKTKSSHRRVTGYPSPPLKKHEH